jgi:hypothetical protein
MLRVQKRDWETASDVRRTGVFLSKTTTRITSCIMLQTLSKPPALLKCRVSHQRHTRICSPRTPKFRQTSLAADASLARAAFVVVADVAFSIASLVGPTNVSWSGRIRVPAFDDRGETAAERCMCMCRHNCVVAVRCIVRRPAVRVACYCSKSL